MGVLTETGLKYLAQKIKNKLDNTTYEFQEVESLSSVVNIPNNVLPIASIDKIGGMSYKSKNLFNFSKLKFDSSITSIDYNNKTVTVPATTWFSASTSTLKDVCPSLNVGDTLYINAVYSNSNVAKAIRIKNTYSFNSPITITEDVLNSPITFLNDNSSYENIVSEIIFSKEPITEYEDYFEGIRDTKVTNIKVVGANLFNFETENYEMSSYNKLQLLPDTYGIRVIVNYNSTNDHVTNVLYFVKVKPEWYGKTLRFLCEKSKPSNNNTGDILIGFSDENHKHLYNIWATPSNTPTIEYSANTNFVLPNDRTIKYINISFYGNSDRTIASQVPIGAYVDYDYIYLGIDKQDNMFVPYHEENITIPSEVQALDGYGLGINEQYNNYIDYDRGMFIKKVYKYIFSGNEIFTSMNLSTTNTQGWYVGLTNIPKCSSDKVNTTPLINNRNLPQDNVWSGSRDYECIDIYENANYNIFAAKVPSSLTTSQEVADYLNGLEIIYALNTPIETDISDLLSNNFIKVFPSGNISFIDQNNYNYPVPNTISFQQKVEKL